MSFPFRYSRIAESMRPSPIRELFKLTQQAGMISFAGGLPDPSVFPVEQFAACATALSEKGRVALQYGASEGYAPLVETICARMEGPMGCPVAPESVVIGSGSQQLLDMLARVLLDPGDVVAVESPTYPGALHTLRNAGARFLLLPSDDQGLRVEALPELLQGCQRETGVLPRFIYTVVNFSNPSGATLSEARRARLAELAHGFGIPVLEDDPYGELRYEGTPQPTLFAMAGGRGVIYASSFSKILAPGARVAWAVADPALVRRMVLAKQGMDLCTSMVAQVLVAEYCRRGHLDGHLPAIRRHYAAKASAMGKALEAHLAGVAHWTRPQGGFFYWLELPGHDTRQLFARAIPHGIAFLPGDAFFPAGDEVVGPPLKGATYLRLCFTFAAPDEIEEGCGRLRAAVEEEPSA